MSTVAAPCAIKAWAWAVLISVLAPVCANAATANPAASMPARPVTSSFFITTSDSCVKTSQATCVDVISAYRHATGPRRRTRERVELTSFADCQRSMPASSDLKRGVAMQRFELAVVLHPGDIAPAQFHGFFQQVDRTIGVTLHGIEAGAVVQHHWMVLLGGFYSGKFSISSPLGASPGSGMGFQRTETAGLRTGPSCEPGDLFMKSTELVRTPLNKAILLSGSLTVLVVGIGGQAGALAGGSPPLPAHFSGLLNDYTPTIDSNTGNAIGGSPYEMHGRWTLNLNARQSKATFSTPRRLAPTPTISAWWTAWSTARRQSGRRCARRSSHRRPVALRLLVRRTSRAMDPIRRSAILRV